MAVVFFVEKGVDKKKKNLQIRLDLFYDDYGTIIIIIIMRASVRARKKINR